MSDYWNSRLRDYIREGTLNPNWPAPPDEEEEEKSVKKITYPDKPWNGAYGDDD